MPRAIVCVLALTVMAASIGPLAIGQQASQKPPEPAVQQPASSGQEVRIGDLLIAKPIRCKNLTVFPVLSTTPKNEDRYIILEEGLKGGKVDVYEVGAEPGSAQRQPTANQGRGYEAWGDVNHLMGPQSSEAAALPHARRDHLRRQARPLRCPGVHHFGRRQAGEDRSLLRRARPLDQRPGVYGKGGQSEQGRTVPPSRKAKASRKYGTRLAIPTRPAGPARARAPSPPTTPTRKSANGSTPTSRNLNSRWPNSAGVARSSRLTARSRRLTCSPGRRCSRRCGPSC